MVYRDPKCIYITDNPGTADVVVNFLEHEGIAAKVMDRSMLGGLLGLTIWSKSGVSSLGLEVWVLDEKDVESASSLLAKYEEEAARKKQAKSDSPPVDAVCDDCGKTSTFAGKLRGSVQDCPQCGEYMDVPEEDDEFDWSAADADEP